MLPRELEDTAAHHVPGSGSVGIHRLRRGLVNETYRVLRDGNSYALRVAAANPYELGLDREWEARVLEGAVAAGLAPAIEYCEPQRGILIARWVDGREWSAAEVRRPANIFRIAELMRRIHVLQMPTPARVMTPMNWIDYYSEALSKSTGRDPGDPGVRCTSAALQTAARGRVAVLAALSGFNPVVCHSDLHTFNLLDRGHSLVLLDWEYAHASDPLWDLAGWSANNDFEDAFKQELLASYLRRLPTPDEGMRLTLLGWLYDYVCLLWSELYLNLHRDAGPGVAIPDDAAQGGVAARAALLSARLDASK